ncbi:MAG: nuclear transport factor 2 family protein [Chitinophagaceae bacterium]
MKKAILFLLASAAIQISSAQKAKEVVNAELAFAKLAVDSGMKPAFLHFLDSNGVVFNRGVISNGIRQWQAIADAPGKLLWQPSYAVIAASGDMGFTTGPFEFRRTMNDTVSSSGQYATIWHKNNKGEWKFLADLGINYAPSQFNVQQLQYIKASLTPSSDTGILQTEQAFIEHFNTDSVKAFLQVLHPEAWFNIAGKPPVHTQQAITEALAKIPQQLVFVPAGSGIAASKDFAYVYGTVLYSNRKENYLRAWIHTQSGWKLLLQVLKW